MIPTKSDRKQPFGEDKEKGCRFPLGLATVFVLVSFLAAADIALHYQRGCQIANLEEKLGILSEKFDTTMMKGDNDDVTYKVPAHFYYQHTYGCMYNFVHSITLSFCSLLLTQHL